MLVEERQFPVLDVVGSSAEPEVFVRCPRLLQGQKLDPFRMGDPGSQGVQKGQLAFELHPFVLAGMNRQGGKLSPPIQVLDGVESIRRLVIEELALLLDPPVAAGRLQQRGTESMRSLEPHQRDHATHGHATDRHAVEIEAMPSEGGDHIVDLGGRLLDIVEEGFRSHARGGASFPMSGEIDGTGADSGPGEAEIPARIQFLGGGSSVHPEQEREGIGPVTGRSGLRPHHETGHVGAQEEVLGKGSQAGWKAGIQIGHGATIAERSPGGDTVVMIKILGGRYRSRILESPPDSDTTRPITARVKESVFNLLRGWFEDASVLDLFAGIGTIGLEAVSRGATDVVMIEQDRRTAGILRFNVEELGCGDRATVVQADAFGPAALAQAPRSCDIVFLDPPYPLLREEATRDRVLELAVRCRSIMNPKSFLVLRTPEDFGDDFAGLPGFDGPETHRYAEDMYVHLFMPSDEVEGE